MGETLAEYTEAKVSAQAQLEPPVKETSLEKESASEEQLENSEKELMERIHDLLQEMDSSLERKIKHLEVNYQLPNHSPTHANSNSNSQSVTEELSAQDLKRQSGLKETHEMGQTSTTTVSCHDIHRLLQSLLDKLQKHTRLEEGFVKRIHDTELSLGATKDKCSVSENEPLSTVP